ncbi:MAG: PAS domain S-box protein [Thermoanaerobaculia bacterium]|nr:PAS domain S-box protein [Thermoanaerobaculia bacterium]
MTEPRMARFAAWRRVAGAVWTVIGSDRLILVALALGVLLALFLLLPVAPPETRRVVIGWLGPAAFALLLPYALLHGKKRRTRRVEAAFWRDLLLAAWSTIAAVVLRRVSDGLDWDPAMILSRLSLVVTYTLLVIAVERQPHRASADSKSAEMRLTLPTILLLVVGLIFYFVLLPVLAVRDQPLELTLMSQILTTLGILLLVRVSYFALKTDTPRWRAVYSIVGLLAVSIVLFHGRELPAVARWFGEPGLFDALLWLPAMLLAVILVRLKHHSFPVDLMADVDMVTQLSEQPTGVAQRTLFVALAVPVIHFGAYRFNLFDPTLEASREAWVFFWIVGLGGVALFQNRRLSVRLTSAFRERRRIENALANTERSLRLADARRQSEEAVWSKKEKYVKAFRYSPDATLLTTIHDGRLLEFNNRFLEILGYRREEVTDRTVFDIDLWADPELRETLTDALREQGYVRNREVQVRTRDGNLRWVSVSAEALQVDSEPCLFAVARDITGREERLQALHRQAALLDLAIDPIVVMDRDDIVTYGNDAAGQLLGQALEKLRGNTLASALSTESAEEIDHASRMTRQHGVWKGSIRTRDGTRLDALWSLVTDAEGAASAKLVLLRE